MLGSKSRVPQHNGNGGAAHRHGVRLDYSYVVVTHQNQNALETLIDLKICRLCFGLEFNLAPTVNNGSITMYVQYLTYSCYY